MVEQKDAVEHLDLHGLALNYRTAQTYGEAQAAWLRLEARVANMVEEARGVKPSLDAQMCAMLASDIKHLLTPYLQNDVSLPEADKKFVMSFVERIREIGGGKQ